MNLTIIIPSRNRPTYLSRAIAYFAGFSEVEILVCDSSNMPYSQEIPSNVKYFHSPNITFVQKIQRVLTHIKTDYVVLCADDDFLIPKALKECVEFLDHSPEYHSAQGNYIAYYQLKNHLFYLPLYTKNLNKSIDYNAPIDRISAYWGANIQLFYSVHRFNSFCTVFNSANSSITSLNLLEYHIGLSALIMGKNKQLPIFYGVRELISNSAGTAIGIDVLSSNPDQHEQYEAFIGGISTLFKSKQPELGGHEEIIREQVVNYLLSAEANVFYQKRRRNQRIKRLFPRWIRNFGYKSWLFINLKNNRRQNVLFAKANEGFPFGDSINESILKNLEQIILNKE